MMLLGILEILFKCEIFWNVYYFCFFVVVYFVSNCWYVYWVGNLVFIFDCLKVDVVELDIILVDIVKFVIIDLVIFGLDIVGCSGYCWFVCCWYIRIFVLF